MNTFADLPVLAHSVIVLWLAVAADRLFGDPLRWHPVAGLGQLAAWLEPRARRFGASEAFERVAGIACVALLVVPAGFIAWQLARLPVAGSIAEVVMLYFCIASRSLEEHARAVLVPLVEGRLDAAREAIGRIVSRDTRAMAPDDIARASVETVLENGNDAVFGAIFWFILLGAPGAVMFRIANTLDAMWGYRNDRYRYFGWAAARFDDVLNYIPARLTALSYCLAGNLANGLACWRTQARTWYSPNAGPVMAAGAGALSVELGGRAKYDGQWKDRPVLGRGHSATTDDVQGAITLLRRSLALWLIVITMISITDGLLHGIGGVHA